MFKSILEGYLMYTLVLWSIIAVSVHGDTQHGWLYVDHFEEVYHEGQRLKAKDLCEATAKVKRIPSGLWKCFQES